MPAFADFAAVRLRARLQPIGGPGTFVQPPTYISGQREVVVAHHERRIDGQDVHCTLVASVACMANRFEESLEALRAAGVPLSIAEVHADIDGYPLHETTLTMPHRGADAIARSCRTSEGVWYMESPAGRALLCNTSDVRPLAKWHQTMLLLGGWFSARSHGGVRIPRSLQAEVVAVNSRPCVTVGGRFDQTPASNAVQVYRKPGDGTPFEMKGSGKGNKPSELPIGMIPSGVEMRGVTADYYDLTATLSLASLRRLRCGDRDAEPLHDALAQLGLATLIRSLADGIHLRSRCHLIVEGEPVLELVGAQGKTQALTMSSEEALNAARGAIERCNASGIEWGNENLKLQPSEQLQQLIAKSLAVGAAE